MVDATRRMSVQFLSIRSAFTLPPTSWPELLRDTGAFEHVQLRRQVPDARDERVAEDRARGEDMVGEATRIGVLFADAPPGLVHQESVEDVGGFVDGGGDGLGGERGEPVGDVRVRLEAGFGSVAGVDQVEGFAAAGGREELAVARGGPTRTPEGRHRQGGLGLDDHGQRPVIRFAFDVPARDAHQFPEPVRGRGFGHLAQAEIDAPGEQHVEQADAVATGRPGAQVREGLGEPGGVVHLEQNVRDPRVGYPLIEVGDEVAGPVRRLQSFRCGACPRRCWRPRSHRLAPRRPASADPRPARPCAPRASPADWPGPAGCGRHQQQREPTAASS